MIITNAKVVLKDRIITNGWIAIKESAIAQIGEGSYTGSEKEIIDANGNYILPGFVDLHTHGSGGFDFMDGTVADILGASKSLAKYGTTTCFPTTLTASDDEYLNLFKNMKELKNHPVEGCAKMPKIHMEGPYFDMVQKGAQDPRYIRNPDEKHYRMLMEKSEGIIGRWSVAPELEGAQKMIKDLSSEGVLISAGHTDATYDDISRAYDNGAKLLTHFYSGMSTISRRGGFRVLGTVEAGYLIDGLHLELICDGKHLPPELLEMIFKFKNSDHIISCSDSMRGAGMSEGPSILGPKHNGTDCIIEDGIAKMPDRTCFAGSVATGNRLAHTLHCILGKPMEEVSRITSLQPATLAGLDKEIGSIEVGKKADLVICDENINVKHVFIDGRKVKED